MKQFLVLSFNGGNYCTGLTHFDMKRALAALDSASVDDMAAAKIERIYDVDTLSLPVDLTKQIAKEWADGLDVPHCCDLYSYLSRFPAFVRAHYRDELIAKHTSASEAQHVEIEVGGTIYSVSKEKAEAFAALARAL